MTEQELAEIERGVTRWHSVSTDVAKRLIQEIRLLKAKIGEQNGREG